MAMSTLPSGFPVDDIQFLITSLTTGDTSNLRQIIASLFGLAEYAASVLLPAQQVIPAFVGPLTVHHTSALVGHLTAALNAGAPDWTTILQIVLTLLQTYLAQRKVVGG